MKLAYSLTIALLFVCLAPVAQKSKITPLRTGTIQFEEEIKQSAIDLFNQSELYFHNKGLFVLRFQSIPSGESIKTLAENGVHLLDYISDNTYLAAAKGSIKSSVLKKVGGN